MEEQHDGTPVVEEETQEQWNPEFRKASNTSEFLLVLLLGVLLMLVGEVFALRISMWGGVSLAVVAIYQKFPIVRPLAVGLVERFLPVEKTKG